MSGNKKSVAPATKRLSGWFGFIDEVGRTNGVDLGTVESFLSYDRANERTSIVLYTASRNYHVTQSEDVEALAVILDALFAVD